jgi:ATP-binding cassette subfamily B protein
MWNIAKFLRPYAGQVAVAMVLVVLQVFASLGLPTVMAKIVDVGIPAGDLPYIWKMGAVMLGMSLLQVAVMVGIGFLSARVSSAFGRDVRRKVFEKVEASSMAEVDQFGISSLITRTTNDITQVQNFIVMLLRMVVMAPIMFIGSVVLAIGVDRELSMVILTALPLLLVLIALILTKASKMFASLQAKMDRLNLLVRERLAGTRVIRAFVTTEYERKRFDAGNSDLTRTTTRVQAIAGGMLPGMIIIMNLTTVAVMWFGGVRVEDGGMQVLGGKLFYQEDDRKLQNALVSVA